jgi:hypothetical protein
MINCVSEEFRNRFDLGLNCYLSGKWPDAKLQ